MTREEILAMEPGRELDALVAEKVMGWVKNDLNFNVWWNGETYTPSIKPYSTDISAAWEVVEKIKNQFTIRITINHDFTGIEYWNHKTARIEKAPTTPEAICKAALLAVMDA